MTAEGVGGSVGADLAAIEARLAKATPGPWNLQPNGVLLGPPGNGAGEYALAQWVTQLTDTVYDADAEFIANAPTDIAALLAEVSRLGQQLKAETEALEHASMQFVRAATERDAAVQQLADDRATNDRIGRAYAQQAIDDAAERDAALALVGQLHAENRRLRGERMTNGPVAQLAEHREQPQGPIATDAASSDGWAFESPSVHIDALTAARAEVGQLQGQLDAVPAPAKVYERVNCFEPQSEGECYVDHEHGF